MEAEEEVIHQFQISHYVNHIEKKKAAGKQKKLFLYLSDEQMIIKEEDLNGLVDRFKYKEMSFIYLVEKQEKENKKDQKKDGGKEVKKYVLYIKEKSHAELTASFRNHEAQASRLIEKFVNRQIQLKSDVDQYQTLYHKQNVIKMIKEKEKNIYGPIYQKYKSKGLFSAQWLDSFLFQDHSKIKQYNLIARERANENERKLILTKMRAKQSNEGREKQSKIEIPLQSYDFDKINEGTRFHDVKRVNFVPKEEDKQEDLIVEALPNPEKYYQVDHLDQLNFVDSKMEVQSDARNKVSLDVEKKYENGITLPKPEKDRFKLLQKKGINLDEGRQGSIFEDRRKMDEREFNEVVAKKIKIWIKIFYKIQGHSQLRRDHINAIESQLNNLLNSEPKLPLFLERAIQKTQKNILEWKRNEGNMHLY